jgi:ABC-type transport system substrate-binding protein
MDSRAWSDLVITRKEHMLVFLNWAFTVADVESALGEFFACQKYAGEHCAEVPVNNVSQYANPEVDRLLQQALKEQDQGRRTRLYARAEGIIVDDAPAVFVNYGARNLVVRSNVRELVASPLDSLFAGQHFLERAYIAKE